MTEPCPTKDRFGTRSKILANVKHEPKSSGTKKIARCNKNRGKMQLILTHNPSCRREPTKASDAINDTPSDGVKCKVDRSTGKRECFSYQAAGRHFQRLHLATSWEEWKAQAAPRHEKQILAPLCWAPMVDMRGNPSLLRRTCSRSGNETQPQ